MAARRKSRGHSCARRALYQAGPALAGAWDVQPRREPEGPGGTGPPPDPEARRVLSASLDVPASRARFPKAGFTQNVDAGMDVLARADGYGE